MECRPEFWWQTACLPILYMCKYYFLSRQDGKLCNPIIVPSNTFTHYKLGSYGVPKATGHNGGIDGLGVPTVSLIVQLRTVTFQCDTCIMDTKFCHFILQTDKKTTLVFKKHLNVFKNYENCHNGNKYLHMSQGVIGIGVQDGGMFNTHS